MTRVLLAAPFVLAALPVQFAVAQGPAPSPPVLEEIRPLNPPSELAEAQDTRWQADGNLLVGLRRDSIRAWTPGTSETRLVATLAGTTHRRAAKYGNYSRLGGGATDGLVFAGDLFGVYRQRGGTITALKANLEIVGDLDHQAGWTVAVGLARRLEPSPSPEGIWEPYVAWLIDAEGGVRGPLPTRDGGVAMDACYPVELSVSRFVADDVALVIPGAEPGAFLYGMDGMLRGAVDLRELSATRPDCGPKEKPRLYEEEFRTAWLSRHRVIDEVVANGQGDVFFFVRHVDESGPPAGGAGVCWDVVRARVEDLSPASSAPCAVRSDLADARLRVDLAGDRAVLLVRGATRLSSAGVTRPGPTEFFEARLRAGS